MVKLIHVQNIWPKSCLTSDILQNIQRSHNLLTAVDRDMTDWVSMFQRCLVLYLYLQQLDCGFFVYS